MIKQGIVKTLETIVFACMTVMAIAVIFQVFSRYVLHDPSKYSEEIATTLMIWVGIFGAALGFERGMHLGVDILMQLLNPACRKLMQVLTLILILLFAVLIWCWGGWEITAQAFTSDNTFKTMPFLSRGWAYVPIPLCGILVCYFTLCKLIEAVRPSEEVRRG